LSSFDSKHNQTKDKSIAILRDRGENNVKLVNTRLIRNPEPQPAYKPTKAVTTNRKSQRNKYINNVNESERISKMLNNMESDKNIETNQIQSELQLVDYKLAKVN
jgi:hypothetical protein